MVQGTLDMLILRTLVGGRAHGHTIAQMIEQPSDDVLQVEQGSCTLPCTGWRIEAGWLRHGERVRTTGRHASMN